MADIKFGLNVNRSLADVADPAAALENIGIDINDLDVIIRPRAWNFDSDGEYRTKDIEFFDNFLYLRL